MLTLLQQVGLRIGYSCISQQAANMSINVISKTRFMGVKRLAVLKCPI